MSQERDDEENRRAVVGTCFSADESQMGESDPTLSVPKAAVVKLGRTYEHHGGTLSPDDR